MSFTGKKKFPAGRILSADLDRHGLKRGDRLVPCDLHLDIACIDAWEDVSRPRQLKFWRGTNGIVLAPNPLYRSSTWLSPAALCVDEMHTMHLGTFAVYVACALWKIVASDAWGIRGLDAASANRANFDRVKQKLNAWYKVKGREASKAGGRKIYPVDYFDLKCIGAEDSPSLSGPKAAQTGSLMLFVVDLLRECWSSVVGGKALLRCGECLERYLSITRKAGPRLRPGETQALFDAILGFLSMRESAQLPWIPKMHLMVHLAHQAAVHGNPAYLATWHDEAVNMHFSKVCQAAHPIVFEKRVLATLSHKFGLTSNPSRPGADPAEARPSKQQKRL